MDFLKRHLRWLVVLIGVFFIGGYAAFIAPPTNFPSGNIVVIARGASVSDIAAELFHARAIKHPTVLQVLLRMSGTSSRVQAGAYLFKSPENVFTIAYRLVAGVYGLPPVRITFPEGDTVRDIAARVHDAFPNITESDFLVKAQSYEGYLFPDTYLFSSSSDIESILKTMRTNFETKIATIADDVSSSGHSLSDIVIMASLVEKEARTIENKRIIAGILWSRLSLGMPLQVDAVFGFILGRDTYSPSFADLKIASPYNTYIHTGLPPGPIDNPGMETIEAVLHPTKTSYLYYLTDKEGVMHYATTYAVHQANQKRYLQ